MKKNTLAVEKISDVMKQKGLSPASIASTLNVSRTIVSDWLKGKKFPRPGMLLRLGKLLGFSYAELVNTSTNLEPVVAYRKHGNSKTKDSDSQKGKDFGNSIRLLMKYLPITKLDSPSKFINPSLDSSYLEEAAKETRRRIGKLDGCIEIEDIIDLYTDLKTILIPVFWGEKEGSANGLYVYLPDTQATFVYLNLDSKLYDFKFWMLHELAHIKTYDLLESPNSEIFADSFASAVLVPLELAISLFDVLVKIVDMGARITKILEISRSLVISPITIATRVDDISKSRTGKTIIGKSIYPATTNFNKNINLVSTVLFPAGLPEASDFITISEHVFKTPIFSALRSYLYDHEASESIIKTCLGIGPVDAKGILSALLSK